MVFVQKTNNVIVAIVKMEFVISLDVNMVWKLVELVNQRHVLEMAVLALQIVIAQVVIVMDYFAQPALKLAMV